MFYYLLILYIKGMQYIPLPTIFATLPVMLLYRLYESNQVFIKLHSILESD